jgi:hypothetical protein
MGAGIEHRSSGARLRQAELPHSGSQLDFLIVESPDSAPRSITARINMRAHVDRQVRERLFVAAMFAGTMGFVASQPFGTGLAVGIGVAMFAAGVALVVALRFSALRNAETDFDSIRQATSAMGNGPTPEERLEAFDSIRMLTGADLPAEGERGSSEPPIGHA